MTDIHRQGKTSSVAELRSSEILLNSIVNIRIFDIYEERSYN
jgi:hypothetical protein